MIHSFRTGQIIPASLEACWAFFSDPRNLARLTPPSLDLQVLHDLPREIHPGLMIEYRIRPLFRLRMRWLNEITHVERPYCLIDEQRAGPYGFWHHEHHFRGLDDGRVEMHDIVHYILPYSQVSEILHPLLVAPKLRKIFAYRAQAVREYFSATS